MRSAVRSAAGWTPRSRRYSCAAAPFWPNIRLGSGKRWRPASFEMKRCFRPSSRLPRCGTPSRSPTFRSATLRHGCETTGAARRSHGNCRTPDCRSAMPALRSTRAQGSSGPKRTGRHTSFLVTSGRKPTLRQSSTSPDGSTQNDCSAGERRFLRTCRSWCRSSRLIARMKSNRNCSGSWRWRYRVCGMRDGSSRSRGG